MPPPDAIPRDWCNGSPDALDAITVMDDVQTAALRADVQSGQLKLAAAPVWGSSGGERCGAI